MERMGRNSCGSCGDFCDCRRVSPLALERMQIISGPLGQSGDAVGEKCADRDTQFSFALLLDKLGDIGREGSYLIVACTVITEVPEAVGP